MSAAPQFVIAPLGAGGQKWDPSHPPFQTMGPYGPGQWVPPGTPQSPVPVPGMDWWNGSGYSANPGPGNPGRLPTPAESAGYGYATTVNGRSVFVPSGTPDPNGPPVPYPPGTTWLAGAQPAGGSGSAAPTAPAWGAAPGAVALGAAPGALNVTPAQMPQAPAAPAPAAAPPTTAALNPLHQAIQRQATQGMGSFGYGAQAPAWNPRRQRLPGQGP